MPKMYKRKTRDRWDVEINRGSGWKVKCSRYSREEAKEQLKLFQKNTHGRVYFRIKKRRELITGGDRP